MLNCSKQGKGGIWIEADTTDSGDVTYAVSRYKNGLRHRVHFTYRQTATGLMWRREKGEYRRGEKSGFWRYYTTCGHYINWVYYLGERQIHARTINSVYAFQTCACDGQ